MRTRKMTIGLVTLVVLTGFVAFAPSAEAQAQATTANLEIKLDPIQQPIMPLSGLEVTTISGKYVYQAGGYSLTPTQVNFKVTNAPPWATVTISPSTVLVPVQANPQAGQGSLEVQLQKVDVIVSTTADAPAFTPANIEVQATAAQNGNIGPANAPASTPIRADYFSIIDGVAQTTIQTARPQAEVAYPVNVNNFGNGPTKLFFDITDKPESWQMVAPSPITLESKQAGGKNTASTVNLMIQTPFRNGYLNEVGSATMQITSAYSLDSTKKGDTTTVSTLTTTRGFYVPGLTPLYIIAGLGAVALTLRGRIE